MNADSSFLKIQKAVANVPLESILQTAKSIAKDTNIPFIPLVITLLEILIQWRPLANSLLGTGAETDAFVQNVKNGNHHTEEEIQATRERAEIMAMLDQMIEIAAEDGELSNEELSYLMEIAKEVDINEKAVMAKVRMKCLQNR